MRRNDKGGGLQREWAKSWGITGGRRRRQDGRKWWRRTAEYSLSGCWGDIYSCCECVRCWQSHTLMETHTHRLGSRNELPYTVSNNGEAVNVEHDVRDRAAPPLIQSYQATSAAQQQLHQQADPSHIITQHGTKLKGFHWPASLWITSILDDAALYN